LDSNEKQKIYKILDSLTQTELENYISDRNILETEIQEFKNKYEMLNRIKISRENNHLDTITVNLYSNIQDSINKYYKLGMAKVIAPILQNYHDEKFKITDLQKHIKDILETDKDLKEYVYEIMKDF